MNKKEKKELEKIIADFNRQRIIDQPYRISLLKLYDLYKLQVKIIEEVKI